MKWLMHWEDLVGRVIAKAIIPPDKGWRMILEFKDDTSVIFMAGDAPSLSVEFYPADYRHHQDAVHLIDLAELNQQIAGARICGLVVPISGYGFRTQSAVRFVLESPNRAGWLDLFLASEDPLDPVLIVKERIRE